MQPGGFRNTGAICWCNSLLQALLSLDPYYNFLKQNELGETSSTEQELRNLVDNIENKQNITNSSVKVLQSLITDLKEQKKNIDMGFGQQSASEGLILMLDVINNKKMDQLFDHVFEETIICLDNNNIVSNKRDINNIIYVFDEDYLLRVGLRDYIMKHYHNMEDTYIPDPKEYKHHNKNNKYRRIYALRRLPEIIVVALNRYNITDGWKHKKRNPNIKLPDILEFPHKNGHKLIYNKVAEIDHMGGLGGGHYIARGLRDGKVYVFNDSNVSSNGKLETLTSTYLTFYNCQSEA